MKISTPNDALERQADEIATRALGARTVGPAPAPTRAPVHVQRACAKCDEEQTVQRSAAGDAPAQTTGIAGAIAAMRGHGEPMPGATRTFMESRLGGNFSGVRLHRDGAAANVADGLSAHAFTVGRDIFFARGAYDPQSASGRHLIAHELVHVMQQEGSPDGGAMFVQRATRGAGGCGPLADVDEDNAGARGAGLTAHRQIQEYLLSSLVFSELEIPRATKTNIDNNACQAPGTEAGFEDLYRPGNIVQLAEIKPYGYADTIGVREVEHYIRRAEQSMQRNFPAIPSPCADQGRGTDDALFAARIGASTFPPVFMRMNNVLLTDTVIGPFRGDTSRTLKARMRAPGAVGYWCTGGGSDTFTCGASEQEMNAFLDRAMVPAGDALNQFVDGTIRAALDRMIGRLNTGEILEAAVRYLGPRLEAILGADIARALSLLPGGSLRAIGNWLDSQIGPQMRGLIQSLAQDLANRIITELRIQLRNALREMLREALVALCVGAPVVAFAELMDRLRQIMRDRARQLMPVVVGAAVTAFVAMLLSQIAATLAEWMSALGRAVSWLLDWLLRVLAVLAVLIVVVGVIVMAIVTVAAIIDPVPGDEVAAGAATLGLARLIPVLINFIRTGIAVAPAAAAMAR